MQFQDIQTDWRYWKRGRPAISWPKSSPSTYYFHGRTCGFPNFHIFPHLGNVSNSETPSWEKPHEPFFAKIIPFLRTTTLHHPGCHSCGARIGSWKEMLNHAGKKNMNTAAWVIFIRIKGTQQHYITACSCGNFTQQPCTDLQFCTCKIIFFDIQSVSKLPRSAG